MTDSEFRTIQSIGRFELIEELTENNGAQRDEVVQGVGDDAAVIRAGEGWYSLLTSETYMEGVDFDLTYTPLHHLGYKILSTTLSDIYAMNGTPSVALINLAVPNKLSVDMLKQIYKGINAAAEDFGVQIVGGDLTASHHTLSLSVSCMGKVKESRVSWRSGAKEGDAICLSGDLGGAIAGLRILMREKEFWEEQEDQQQAFQPDLDGYEYVVKKQLLPYARKDIIDVFHQNKIKPGAMIDISQGLVSELKQITNSSGVGAHIYQAALPIAPDTREVANEMKEDVDKYALYGGEDLELMFTLREEQLNTFSDVLTDINVIGKIDAPGSGIKMQTGEGDLIEFEGDN